MNKDKEIKSKIEKAIYSYGIFPCLLYLKECEDLEEYELCVLLKEAIIKVTKSRYPLFNTKTDVFSLKNNFSFLFEYSTEKYKKHYIKNNYYINEFKEMLNEKSCKSR